MTRRAVLLLALLGVILTASWQTMPDIIVGGTEGIWTDTRAYSDFATAIAAVGASNRTVYVFREETVSGNLTVQAGTELRFFGGGSIDCTSGTLTISTNQINSPPKIIFKSGGGDYDFLRGSVLASRWFDSFYDAIYHTNNDTVTIKVTNKQYMVGDAAVGDDVTLWFPAPGADLTVTITNRISNIKNVIAGQYEILNGAGDIDFADGANLKFSWFPDPITAISYIQDAYVSMEVDIGFELLTSLSIEPEMQLVWKAPGNMIEIGAGLVLDFQQSPVPIAPPNIQIFDGEGHVDLERSKGDVYANWFPGDDLDDKVRKAFFNAYVLTVPTYEATNVVRVASVGLRSRAYSSSSYYEWNDTITLGSHQTLIFDDPHQLVYFMGASGTDATGDADKMFRIYRNAELHGGYFYSYRSENEAAPGAGAAFLDFANPWIGIETVWEEDNGCHNNNVDIYKLRGFETCLNLYTSDIDPDGGGVVGKNILYNQFDVHYYQDCGIDINMEIDNDTGINENLFYSKRMSAGVDPTPSADDVFGVRMVSLDADGSIGNNKFIAMCIEGGIGDIGVYLAGRVRNNQFFGARLEGWDTDDVQDAVSDGIWPAGNTFYGINGSPNTNITGDYSVEFYGLMPLDFNVTGNVMADSVYRANYSRVRDELVVTIGTGGDYLYWFRAAKAFRGVILERDLTFQFVSDYVVQSSDVTGTGIIDVMISTGGKFIVDLNGFTITSSGYDDVFRFIDCAGLNIEVDGGNGAVTTDYAPGTDDDHRIFQFERVGDVDVHNIDFTTTYVGTGEVYGVYARQCATVTAEVLDFDMTSGGDSYGVHASRSVARVQNLTTSGSAPDALYRCDECLALEASDIASRSVSTGLAVTDNGNSLIAQGNELVFPKGCTALASGDTTPSLEGDTCFTANNNGSVTLFTDSVDGQTYVIRGVGVGSTIITDGTNIRLESGSNFTIGNTDTFYFIMDGATAYEISRSNN